MITSYNRDTLVRVQKDDPTLRVLRISSIKTPNLNLGDVGCFVVISPDSHLESLGDRISSNTSIECIIFDRLTSEHVGGDLPRRFLEGLMKNGSIRKLKLVQCDLSGALGSSILETYEERGKLTSIAVRSCHLDGGVDALISAIASNSFLQRICLKNCRGRLRFNHEISLVMNHILDESLAAIVQSIENLDRLIELDIGHNDYISVQSCRSLASLLSRPECNLLTLKLENNSINDEGSRLIANSLRRNERLSELILYGNQTFSSEMVHNFEQITCNTSSIADTHSSNHHLETFVSFHSWPKPECLRFNSCPDKRKVAKSKILHFHDLNMDELRLFGEGLGLKMLPVVIAWFDAAACGREHDGLVNKRRLSATYQFIKALPMHAVHVAQGSVNPK
ncbi:hypothetical protein THAOC_35757 [Thalassiosira oceanica]|uniref:Uncharacterized protein n=1 Tax=Thalassiosira oceanica TaxID=159749 RepID=K0RGE1_THAOC|nr:hypothetical protein THAOC_35757 [Thalassiosira oceanica]|eukprot:EJK45622.1 hypothetical protein THAOC_35757 [Thalassiosira oceanica]